MRREAERVILTPEHVQIRLVPAGLGSRFLALLVDTSLVVAVVWLLDLLLALALPLAVSSAATVTAAFGLSWGYPVYFEVYRQGRTPGKRMAGLRVVDGRGLPLTLQQSFARNIVRILDLAPLFYGVGALACLIDRHSRRLGDIVADTLVIEENRPSVLAGRLPPAQRFNSLRAARVKRLIRHRVGLEEREFLLALCLRADGLEARARFDLMEEVGAHYRRRLEIEDPHLSGENLVRDLTSILFDAGSA